MNKRAVIFDMDGVISDTQKFHAHVESKLLAQYGIHLSPTEITRRYAGVSDEIMFEELFAAYNVYPRESISKIVTKKWNMMKTISEGNITPIPYVIDLINSLKRNRFKLAIASSSTHSFISYVSKSLGIHHLFDVLVSAQEVENSKPAPDIFLLTARKLSALPAECIVIEDGKSGWLALKLLE